MRNVICTKLPTWGQIRGMDRYEEKMKNIHVGRIYVRHDYMFGDHPQTDLSEYGRGNRILSMNRSDFDKCFQPSLLNPKIYIHVF